MEQKEKLQEYEKQLQRLTAEVAEMRRQLEFMKKESGMEAEKIPEPVFVNAAEPLKAVLPKQALHTMESVEQKAKQLKKKDLEKTVGKSLMGVFASVLIFISLILFATVLLPYFNDTAKMITTFVLSFAFTGVGLWKLQKDKENKFYIALTGCGIGAVYISLLLSNFYFKAVGDIALYVLIAFWAVAVCFLAKLKNRIFQVIGQLGITIALIFGCMLCGQTDDITKFTALVMFYIVSSSVFYIVHNEKDYEKNRLNLLFNLVNQGVLFLGCQDIAESGFSVVSVLLLMLIAAYMVSMFTCRPESIKIDFGVIFGAYAWLLCCVLSLILDNAYFAFSVTVYVFAWVAISMLEWRFPKGSAGKEIAQGIMIFIMTAGVVEEEILYQHGTIPLVVIPLLLFGFFRANRIASFGSMIVLAVCGFMMNDLPEKECFFLGGLSLALAFYLMYRFKEQYNRWFKCLIHVLTLLLFGFYLPDIVEWCKGSSDLQDALTYGACVLFNMGMARSIFASNLRTGEKEPKTLYNCINLINMFVGTLLISFRYDAVPHMILIVTTLAAFTLNAKNLLEKRDNLFAGIYVGLKFTVLMIAVLNSFHTVNYGISIACLLLAILSIVVGFKGEYRSLRLFGLALSILSTFKLIMVDINYDNTLGNALSFFASGLLCFAISMIYNYIAKKRDKEEE